MLLEKRVINAAISDSLGFGGHNAAILLKNLSKSGFINEFIRKTQTKIRRISR